MALPGGYPGLVVGFDMPAEMRNEKIEEINKILDDADFDMFVQYVSISATTKEFSDDDWLANSRMCGDYWPFNEKSYGEAILGEYRNE